MPMIRATIITRCKLPYGPPQDNDCDCATPESCKLIARRSVPVTHKSANSAPSTAPVKVSAGGISPTRRKHPEDDLQEACVALLRIYEAQGKLTFFAVPNGAHLANAYRQMARLKKLGLRNGVPDLVVLLPGNCAIFYELKAPKGRHSIEQKAWRHALTVMRFGYSTIYSVDQMKTELDSFLKARVT